MHHHHHDDCSCMEYLTVLTIPDPRLKMKGERVETIDAGILDLLEAMVKTMYHDEGCGLSATQVGIAKRLVVIDMGDESTPEPLKMINPEIIWRSPQTERYQEACLSVPGVSAEVERHVEVKVRYTDIHNKTQEVHGKGYFAECLQHELDHLDGILYIDHLSPMKRQLLINKVIKSKRLSGTR
ncbi:peptide deformylase [Candidatus Nucleicultrix amoebiphila]|nr:peptide deformylase [Candidatus Nucleicultrix amoebiphila]